MPVEWKDFLFCLVLGIFGGHKFREGRMGMGFLYLFTAGIFGLGWLFDLVRYLYRAIVITTARHSGRRLQPAEPLPVVPANLVLRGDDQCHYNAPVVHVLTSHEVVGQSGGILGTTIGLTPGLGLNVGRLSSKNIRGDVVESTEGVLCITDERIVFTAPKHSFDRQIADLSSVTPFADAILLQFGDRQRIVNG